MRYRKQKVDGISTGTVLKLVHWTWWLVTNTTRSNNHVRRHCIVSSFDINHQSTIYTVSALGFDSSNIHTDNAKCNTAHTTTHHKYLFSCEQQTCTRQWQYATHSVFSWLLLKEEKPHSYLQLQLACFCVGNEILDVKEFWFRSLLFLKYDWRLNLDNGPFRSSLMWTGMVSSPCLAWKCGCESIVCHKRPPGKGYNW